MIDPEALENLVQQFSSYSTAELEEMARLPGFTPATYEAVGRVLRDRGLAPAGEPAPAPERRAAADRSDPRRTSVGGWLFFAVLVVFVIVCANKYC